MVAPIPSPQVGAVRGRAPLKRDPGVSGTQTRVSSRFSSGP